MTVESAERPLVQTTDQSEILAFSARLSEELRRAARQARLKSVTSGKRPGARLVRHLPWLNTLLATLRRPSFLLCVALPTLLLIGYFGVIAAPQYSSEARFALRAGDTAAIDSVTSLTGLPSVTQFQDTLIVVDYLKSRAIVEELDKRIHLRALFNRPGVDILSRLGEDEPAEDLLRYWRRHISTAIEMPSGIITFEVSAFSPEDAVLIANEVVQLSENLVNTLGERARRDLVAASEREVSRAEQRLRDARAAIKDLRNEVGMLDPKLAAEGINKLIATLKTEQIRLRQEIATSGRNLAGNAPQVQVLKLREEATQEQIKILEQQLTATPSPTASTRTMSHVITRFEEMELNRTLAERLYTLAISNLERSRINAERQQLYLNSFVRPVQPDEPSGPARTRNILLGVIGLIILWQLGLAAVRFRNSLRGR